MTPSGALDLAGLEPDPARLVALVLRILDGDYAARGELSGNGDGMDAVVTALNMLAESFQRESAARGRAEALLADAVESYELAPDGFCSCELDTLEIVECNGALARALGRPRESLLGCSLLEFVRAGSHDALRDALARLAATGVSPAVDVELRVASATIAASLTGAIKRDSGGAPLRFVLSQRDVTAARSLASQLASAQRLDSIGRLAGGVAHDFNNLLTIMMGSADLIGGALRDRPIEREELRALREAADRAAVLIRDLLAFSRHENPETIREPIDEAVRREEAMLRRLLGPTIRLELELAAPHAVVEFGPGHLGQALVNLAVNARDAMGGEGRLRITTRRGVAPSTESPDEALRPGEQVEIVVSDDGPGIPAELQAHVFEPFFTTKPAGKGTGLGLSIVYGNVRRAHGSIRVESRPGEGTSFRMLLPVAPAEVAPPPPRDQTSGRRGVLLVVDDDDGVRRLMARALSAHGYEVVPAGSGAEALQLAHAEDRGIDMVVSDVRMPEMDGVTALEALRGLRPAIPCLFVTGYSEHLQRIRALPRVAVLAKPFAPSSLTAAVDELWNETIGAAQPSSIDSTQR